MSGIRFIVLIGLCLGCLTSLTAGQSLRHDLQLKADGWPVPDIQKLRVKEEAAEDHDGRAITRRDFVLGRYKPNTQLDRNKYCEFFSLSSYVSDGKTFAISGSCVIFAVSVSRSGNFTITSRSYAAAITHYTFYDKDGDGKFESRYNSTYPPK